MKVEYLNFWEDKPFYRHTEDGEEIYFVGKDVHKTYCYTKFGDFFISTIYRQSSCMYGSWYFETLAWELDDKGERGKIIYQSEDCCINGVVDTHSQVAKLLYATGLPENQRKNSTLQAIHFIL